MAFDPALEGCCRRDVEENIQSGRVKLALQRADRASARVRAAGAAIVSDPAALRAAAAVEEARAAERAFEAAARDPSRLDPRMRQGAAAAAAGAAAAAAADEDGEGSDGDSGAGASGDAELAALRAARLQQLRREAAARGGRGAAGYGRLNDVAPEKLLVRALGIRAGSAVAHCPCYCRVAVPPPSPKKPSNMH